MAARVTIIPGLILEFKLARDGGYLVVEESRELSPLQYFLFVFFYVEGLVYCVIFLTKHNPLIPSGERTFTFVFL